MHPDQFVLINSPKEDVFERSLAELLYHCDVLDLMGLGPSAKLQIHVGGAYGDKRASMKRFSERYHRLPPRLKKRLVIENDDILYTAEDCLELSAETGIPVLFDVFHHSINRAYMTARDALERCARTWKKEDGILMTDYSSQKKNQRPGTHADSIRLHDFKRFLALSNADFDIMLEIKDKEASALKAVNAAQNDKRFIRGFQSAGAR